MVPTVPEAVIVLAWPPVFVTIYVQVLPGRVRVMVPENEIEFLTLRKASSAQAFAAPLACIDCFMAKLVREEPRPSSRRESAIDKPTALATSTLTSVINPFLPETC